MLDEKGRLFGKINIVDLLIVLVLIAAVAFCGLCAVNGAGGVAVRDIFAPFMPCGRTGIGNGLRCCAERTFAGLCTNFCAGRIFI